MPDEATVNLLWTGGWDSTFRLLTLVENENVKINIYYIINRERKSFNIELNTMDSILNDIFVRFPGAKDRILSITHFNRNDITPNREIQKKYEYLNNISSFGHQYVYVAEFALMFGLSNLEMSVAFNDGRIYRHLENNCVPVEDPVIGQYHRLTSSIDDNSPYSMFKFFTFPVITVSKIDMMNIAKKNGVLNILKKTWFCHSPINDKICGTCNPCKCAMTEGMAFRLPIRSRLRYYAAPIRSRLRYYVHHVFDLLKREGPVAVFKKAVKKIKL